MKAIIRLERWWQILEDLRMSLHWVSKTHSGLYENSCGSKLRTNARFHLHSTRGLLLANRWNFGAMKKHWVGEGQHPLSRMPSTTCILVLNNSPTTNPHPHTSELIPARETLCREGLAPGAKHLCWGCTTQSHTQKFNWPKGSPSSNYLLI